MTNKEFASSLRSIADFYEVRPNLPQPSSDLFAYMPANKIQEVMTSIGNFDKEYNGNYFTAVKKFNKIEIRFTTPRENVCERVVVGRKLIPAQVIPEHTVPAHEEEVTEWQCHPVLKEPALQVAAFQAEDEELVAA